MRYELRIWLNSDDDSGDPLPLTPDERRNIAKAAEKAARGVYPATVHVDGSEMIEED